MIQGGGNTMLVKAVKCAWITALYIHDSTAAYRCMLESRRQDSTSIGPRRNFTVLATLIPNKLSPTLHPEDIRYGALENYGLEGGLSLVCRNLADRTTVDFKQSRYP
ncbi:hypothetical protein WA026_015396 [Henosepilachna vigintioctopunctata]|uniref:Uncharacterized protein n=1 Tax=Henosepilachna vigintioctopunctata TaxID=420089 RepID=A0AAW1UKN9_9CUCU